MAFSFLGRRRPLIPDRETRLADLRRRGVRGGVIAPHRAMVGLSIPRRRVAAAAITALAGSLAVGLLLQPWAEIWARLFEMLQPRLGLSGEVALRYQELWGWRVLVTPYYTTPAHWPDWLDWRITAGVAGAVAIISFLLPRRLLPLRYFLRFLVLLQAISLGYFALAPEGSFPYSLPDYSSGLLAAGQSMLVLLPLILGFTFYLFDISWPKKIALTILLVGHLGVLLPLQLTIHTWIIARGSLLLMPPLFLVFGLLVQVLVFVAFYGWGMSWQPSKREP